MNRRGDGDERLLDTVVSARRESRSIDFKERFDPRMDLEWVELIKDIVAMANSGGGAIAIGVRDDGSPSGADVSAVIQVDLAVLGDKIFKYTHDHFTSIAIREAIREGAPIAVIQVGRAESPIVFAKPGTYAVGPNSQKTAFGLGTVYVRHGAKSEPATGTDLGIAIERRVDQIRRNWLRDIRRLITAPPGSEVAVVTQLASDAQGRAVRFRFTDDPTATVLGRLEPDQTHPHRQKELIAEVNKRLPLGKHITATMFNARVVRMTLATRAIRA